MRLSVWDLREKKIEKKELNMIISIRIAKWKLMPIMVIWKIFIQFQIVRCVEQIFRSNSPARSCKFDRNEFVIEN